MSGNDHGGGYFTKIDNGERVHRNRITVTPMPEKKVGDVHPLAKN